MSGHTRVAVFVVVSLVLSLMMVAPAGGQQPNSPRIGEFEDVVLAAISISQQSFPEQDAKHVVLGRDDDFADNLAGAPLAGRMGPLLFTTGGPDAPLRPEVRSEIERVVEPRPCTQGVGIYILGGTSAVSNSVELQLQGMDYCVKRFDGSTRVETSVLIAEHIADAGGPPEVLLARADEWADAATGGAYAALSGTPVLVTQKDVLHPAVDTYLASRPPDSIVLLGGTAALSDQVLAGAQSYGSARRVAGSARDSTAVAIAEELWGVSYPDGSRPPGAMVLNGYDKAGWAYALAAAGLSAIRGAPQLYTNETELTPATHAYLSSESPEFLLALGPASLVREETVREAAGLTERNQDAPYPDDAESTTDPPALDETGPAVAVGQAVPAGADESDNFSVPGPPWAMPGEQDSPLNLGEYYGIEPPRDEDAPPPVEATSDLLSTLPSMDDLRGQLFQLSVPQPNMPVWNYRQLAIAQLQTTPMVGQLWVSSGGGYLKNCTGTAVGPDQVLTAGHCFYRDQGRSVWTYFAFCPSQHSNGGYRPYGCWYGTINNVNVPSLFENYRTNQDSVRFVDYGILRVAPNTRGQRLGDVVGYAEPYLNGDQYIQNRYTVGYPIEGYYKDNNLAGTPYSCYSPIRQWYNWGGNGYNRSMGFGCYIGGGWSGGPSFYYAGGRLYLMGVVATGGNLVTRRCNDGTTCRWFFYNAWEPVFRAYYMNPILSASGR